jgi:hypothetical protein
MGYDRAIQLQNVALQLGMQYQAADKWGVYRLLKDFRLFRRGGRRKITNLLSQREGGLESETFIFDYRYVISSGKSSRVYKQTVFFMHSKQLGLPQFLLQPETFFHKVGQLLGMQDIDFEQYPLFSKQYLLRGEDEDYIRASLPDKALQFFTLEKGWSLEGLNYYLVFYKDNHLMLPSQIMHFYRKGMYLHEILAAEQPR